LVISDLQESPMTEPTHEQKLISYLLAVISQSSNVREQRRKPDWVPCRICISAELAPYLTPGEYECQTNVWGAMFVPMMMNQQLGVYVHECEILELRANVKKQSEESAA
jgi:hypothetical protein